MQQAYIVLGIETTCSYCVGNEKDYVVIEKVLLLSLMSFVVTGF